MTVPSTPLPVVDGQGNPQTLEQTTLPSGNLAGGAVITDPATGAKAAVSPEGRLAITDTDTFTRILVELMTITAVLAIGLNVQDNLDQLRADIAADAGLT